MGSVTFPQAGISVVAAKVFDVMVALVEMEIEVASAVGAFHTPGEYARLLCNRGLFPACASFQRLYLFPCRTVNDSLVDIEEDCPVFFRVFNAPLHFVGFGVAFEVDNITAVFLHSEGFLNGGMPPLARLQCAFGAAPVGAFAAPIIGRIENAVSFQSGSSFRISVSVQRHPIYPAHHLGSLRVDHPIAGIVWIFDIAIRRGRKRDAGISFHLIYNPALLGNVLGVPFVHNVAEWGELVIALITIHTIGNSDQTDIMLGGRTLP